jgi:hypothetical protein
VAKKQKHEKKSKAQEKKPVKPFFWVAGCIAVVVAVLLITGTIPLKGSVSVDKRGKSFSVNGEETRSVLDPFLFTGQARKAYIAAKKYPEVLNQVFCYCFCDAEPFNHKSLLSCFTDRHGAG